MPTRTAFTPTATAGQVLTAAQVKQIPGGWLGYTEVTANQAVSTGTETDLTGLSVTVTVGASRRIKVSAVGIMSRSVADGITLGRIKEGATELARFSQHAPSAVTEFDAGAGWAIVTPSAGSHTYKLTMQRFSGTGTVTLNAAVGSAAAILVEDIGPAA